jgi:hypothetical protein
VEATVPNGMIRPDDCGERWWDDSIEARSIVGRTTVLQR